MPDCLSVLQKKPKVETDPFPHVVVRNALPENLYKRLYKSFPPDKTVVGARTYAQNRRYDIPAMGALQVCHPDWHEFIKYHISKEWWLECIEVFGDYIQMMHRLEWYYRKRLRDFNPGIRWVGHADVYLDCQIGINTPTERQGSVRGPHLDTATEVLAGLFYMKDPDDDSGGDLELYRQLREPIFHDKNCLSGDQVEKVKTIPYEANTFVMFVNSALSVHAVSERKPSETSRKLLTICAETPVSLF